MIGKKQNVKDIYINEFLCVRSSLNLLYQDRTTPTLPGRFLFTSSYSNIISLHIKFLFFSADGSKLLARTLIPYARDPGYRTSTYHSPERVVTNGK